VESINEFLEESEITGLRSGGEGSEKQFHFLQFLLAMQIAFCQNTDPWAGENHE